MMDRQLVNILESAYKASEYYRDLFNSVGLSLNDLTDISNFYKIPTLTRSLLRNNSETILSREYKYLKRKHLLTIQTSGSTGEFVDVFWHPKDFICSNLSLWRKRREWYGVTSSQKKCSFVSGTTFGATVTGNNKSLFTLSDSTLELSVLNMSDEVLEKYYKLLVDFEPIWIYTTPSAMIKFIDYCVRRGYKNFRALKYIELASEQVLPSSYAYIKDFFHVPVSIMYGCKETNAIALTCPTHNKLHVLNDNVFIERTHDNKILVTSLKNTVYPIIRYEVGDIGILSDEGCECGQSDLVIEKIKGRERTLAHITKNGVTTSALIDSLYVVNARLDYPIIQYKIFDNSCDVVIQLIIKHNFINWEESIRREINACLQNYGLSFKGIIIDISEKPLDIDDTGKLKLLES